MAEVERRIVCQACGRSGPWRAELAGKKVKCKCGQIITVPPAAAVEPATTTGEPLIDLEDPYALREEPVPQKLPRLAPIAQPVDPAEAEPAVSRFSKFATPKTRDAAAEKAGEKKKILKLLAVMVAIVVIGGGAVLGIKLLSHPKPAVPLHGQDEDVMARMENESPKEIHAWFAQDPSRIAGPWTPQKAMKQADEWQKMGAKQVIAFGPRMSRVLAIELPDDPPQRKALFAWQEQWNLQHRDKVWSDEGQKYLLIDLGI